MYVLCGDLSVKVSGISELYGLQRCASRGRGHDGGEVSVRLRFPVNLIAHKNTIGREHLGKLAATPYNADAPTTP